MATFCELLRSCESLIVYEDGVVLVGWSNGLHAEVIYMERKSLFWMIGNSGRCIGEFAEIFFIIVSIILTVYSTECSHSRIECHIQALYSANQTGL